MKTGNLHCLKKIMMRWLCGESVMDTRLGKDLS